MKIKIIDNYIVFPVNLNSDKKEFSFFHDNKRVYRLDIHYDNISPNFHAYIDVERFKGLELELVNYFENDIEYRFTKEIDLDEIYSEQYRPFVHFTPKNGWLNDPNGLIFDNGKYHLFFQYNPCDTAWGNMHWGHAVSDDLLNWEEKEIALFPTEDGMQFSGSAIKADKVKNGFFADKKEAICLFHTMTTPFSQWMSYSEDGFETIHTYGCVVPQVHDGNRDPKVVFCDELDCYIMIFYLVEDIYTIFTSDNLTHWNHLQDVHVPEDCECPDIFPLVNNLGERKWVLIGAHDRYLTGTVKDNKFVFTEKPKRLHYGISAYAGQTFSGISSRTIRMVWDRSTNKFPRITQQMGMPTELSLKNINGEDILCMSPISEIDVITDKLLSYSDINLSNKLVEQLNESAYLIEINGTKPSNGMVTVSLFGIDFKIDFNENKLIFSDLSMPLSCDNILNLTVLFDRNSIEFFETGTYLTVCDNRTICNYTKSSLIIYSDSQITLSSVKIKKLKNIWE